MDYVLEITGGIGKHVMATSLIKWLNEKYPKKKITIVSAYPEIFEYNPRVHRNLHITQPYLFEDYIKGRDFRKGNPYELQEFYRAKNKKHLMEIFPKAYLFNRLNEQPESEIYLTKGEEMDGQMYCQQNGPLITLQALGGLPPGMSPNRMKVDSSQRDMPQKVAYKVTEMLLRNGFKVLQLRSKVEPIIPGCLQLDLPFRNIIPIVKNAVAHVGIDSSWMHVAGCFKKPMLTFWGGTHKDSFGYFHEGSFHAHTINAMHGRPYFAVHDISAMYPYKTKEDGFEFDYSEREIELHVQKLIDHLKGKVNKEATPQNNGGEKCQNC
jgi:hypothetical protein